MKIKLMSLLLVVLLCLGLSVTAFASGEPDESEAYTIEYDEIIRPEENWRYTAKTADGEELKVLQVAYHGSELTVYADGWDGVGELEIERTEEESGGSAGGGPSFDFAALFASLEALGSFEPPPMGGGTPDPAIVSQFDKIELDPLEYVNDAGETVSDEFVCYVYIPEEALTESVPIVFCLHGIGEVGTDGINLTANRMATCWIDPAWQAEHPCIVMAPQCPEPIADQGTDTIIPAIKDAYVARLKALFDGYIETYSPCKIYMTGVSMGSMNVLHFLDAWPDYPFDACLLCCGCAMQADLTGITGQNILMVNDASDFAVKPAWAHETYNDLVAAGNEKTTFIVTYMNYGHGIWDYVYDNPVFMEWLFEQ